MSKFCSIFFRITCLLAKQVSALNFQAFWRNVTWKYRQTDGQTHTMATVCLRLRPPGIMKDVAIMVMPQRSPNLRSYQKARQIVGSKSQRTAISMHLLDFFNLLVM